MGHAGLLPSLGSDGGKGAVASAASRAAKSKRSASSDSASSPSSSLSSSPSGGGSLGSLAAACAPLPAGALRRRAVEERQRWRRPRHLVPWRRRPSPASPRAPAQHGSPSIAMRAAAYCLAGNLAGCAHPAPPGRHHHLPGGRQPSAQRFCNARPSGSFAVASTPPKGCSAAMGKGHHSYSLPTAAHREQDMEARRETRGAPRGWAGWGISAASGPARPSTPRHPRGTGRLSGCK